MTGTSARTHGVRHNDPTAPMPTLPTLAGSFRDAGYQTYGVGKLHVYPQRDRIGFGDVLLSEEGRTQFGVLDDYESFLVDAGFAGQAFTHGMGNNQYVTRPWHLPEHTHVTNWATQQMAHQLKRRDPTRPAFLYLSYTHPHPPLVPLEPYLDLYRTAKLGEPARGSWAEDEDGLPALLRRRRALAPGPDVAADARRAFCALCTHIDHQLRVVIGTLREERILENTIILFTADHGEMLGEHGLWAKSLFYEMSANIPMILLGTAGDPRVGAGSTDDRLVGLQDVMPTLLDLAGIPAPKGLDGRSMVSAPARDALYGEVGNGPLATRMLRDERFKLIYYPAGNHVQIFDLETDPAESLDVASHEDYDEVRRRLTARLAHELSGDDRRWIGTDGELHGLPDQASERGPDRGLFGQRGLH